jgi:hypothetical protein
VSPRRQEPGRAERSASYESRLSLTTAELSIGAYRFSRRVRQRTSTRGCRRATRGASAATVRSTAACPRWITSEPSPAAAASPPPPRRACLRTPRAPRTHAARAPPSRSAAPAAAAAAAEGAWESARAEAGWRVWALCTVLCYAVSGDGKGCETCFRVEVAHAAVSRRPPVSPFHDCSPYSHVHVRRERLGFAPRPRTLSRRAAPNPNARPLFLTAVSASVAAGGTPRTRRTSGTRSARSERRRPRPPPWRAVVRRGWWWCRRGWCRCRCRCRAARRDPRSTPAPATRSTHAPPSCQPWSRCSACTSLPPWMCSAPSPRRPPPPRRPRVRTRPTQRDGANGVEWCVCREREADCSRRMVCVACAGAVDLFSIMTPSGAAPARLADIFGDFAAPAAPTSHAAAPATTATFLAPSAAPLGDMFGGIAPHLPSPTLQSRLSCLTVSARNPPPPPSTPPVPPDGETALSTRWRGGVPRAHGLLRSACGRQRYAHTGRWRGCYGDGWDGAAGTSNVPSPVALDNGLFLQYSTRWQLQARRGARSETRGVGLP